MPLFLYWNTPKLVICPFMYLCTSSAPSVTQFIEKQTQNCRDINRLGFRFAKTGWSSNPKLKCHKTSLHDPFFCAYCITTFQPTPMDGSQIFLKYWGRPIHCNKLKHCYAVSTFGYNRNESLENSVITRFCGIAAHGTLRKKLVLRGVWC